LLSEKIRRGISLVMAPKGMGAILHVMEFPWRKEGVELAAGGNDADLIRDWPGLLYDNTRDHIIWGVWAAKRNYIQDPTKGTQAEKLEIAKTMTAGWSGNFRRLLEQTDVTTVFSINIRTSVPLEPWATDNVTLLGDAVHTMTPGRGVGANTALRDALTLCRRLIEVSEGKRDLVNAIHAYEVEMLKYSAKAVIESRKQMDARDPIHKPVIGRMVLAMARTGMRVLNLVPALKRRMAEAQMKLRRIEDRELRQSA
jgi:2-polyprenyl-6-methoxyphenol hydroxylase-like FAD-dependent oxidoreductase